MDKYTLHEKVGQGAQGVVYRATDLRSNETVAIKVIDISLYDQRQREAALNEVRVLSLLGDDPHPCLMMYRDSFLHESDLHIVLDWCAGGTLQDLFEKARSSKRRLPEDAVWFYFLSLSAALAHLHKRNILHRDMKMANVFLKPSDEAPFPICQLGDFGVSCVLEDRTRAQTVVGTPYYLSPELCQGQQYGAQSDIWSLGVVLFLLCNERMPFAASNYAALIMQIVQQAHVKQSKNYSPALHRMASACIDKNPLKRPTAESILQHPESVAAARRLGIEALLRPFNPNDSPSRNSRSSRTTAKAAARRVAKGENNNSGEPSSHHQDANNIGSSSSMPLPSLPIRKGTSGSVPNRRVRQNASRRGGREQQGEDQAITSVGRRMHTEDPGPQAPNAAAARNRRRSPPNNGVGGGVPSYAQPIQRRARGDQGGDNNRSSPTHPNNHNNKPQTSQSRTRPPPKRDIAAVENLPDYNDDDDDDSDNDRSNDNQRGGGSTIRTSTLHEDTMLQQTDMSSPRSDLVPFVAASNNRQKRETTDEEVFDESLQIAQHDDVDDDDNDYYGEDDEFYPVEEGEEQDHDQEGEEDGFEDPRESSCLPAAAVTWKVDGEEGTASTGTPLLPPPSSVSSTTATTVRRPKQLSLRSRGGGGGTAISSSSRGGARRVLSSYHADDDEEEEEEVDDSVLLESAFENMLVAADDDDDAVDLAPPESHPQQQQPSNNDEGHYPPLRYTPLLQQQHQHHHHEHPLPLDPILDTTATSTTPTETYGTRMALQEQLERLHDEGEHYVGPRGFVELVVALRQSKEAFEETLTRLQVPMAERHDLTHLCFRYSFLKAEMDGFV